MSHDGELVGFVPIDNAGQSQVVNISTSTNEHGQQVVIIENLHNHSPELQQEILRALMSDTNLIPISNS
jgi:translation initiation factor 1 (eIF-1/SUI1)